MNRPGSSLTEVTSTTEGDPAYGASPSSPAVAPISPTLRMEMSSASAGEKIPIIVVFAKRPSQALELQSLSEPTAQQSLRELAEQQQARAKSYLQTQQKRNRATDPRTLWSTNALAVRATPGTIRELTELPNVERIVYDRKVKPLDGSIEPFADLISKYGNSTAPSGFESDTSGDRVWGVEYIGADAVHERGVTGAGVNVSVIDTGIDGDHPAIEGSIVEWKDFTSDNYTTPHDPFGHGTHVAGTISGSRNASKAVGVAPQANLFGAKIFSKDQATRVSDLIQAFEWSATNDADVISASVGIPPIYKVFDGTRTTGTDDVARSTVPVYANASGLTSSSHDAYKPAYVMVVVEPVAVDGTTIQTDSRREAVMRNLSIVLESPNGSTPLRGINATWAFESGEVPDEIAFRKYKPTKSTPITGGNWTLEVTAENGANVTYRYSAVPVYPTNGSDELAESINTITDSHSVTAVIAAGNYGYVFGNRTISSPGAASEAITVGATGYRTNDVAPYSSRGPIGYGTEQRSGIDVIAPGTSVVSSIPLSMTPDSQSPYASMSGTSMATPHVSGTIALMLAADPTQTPAELRATLRKTAQDVPAPSSAVGAGVVDAYRAVNASNASALEPVTTETGRHTLFAGIGNTRQNRLYVDTQPHTDPEGDSGSAPDIWMTSKFVPANFELATYDDTARNATFRLYVDADRDDATGDESADGAEYMVVMNRSFDGTAYSLTATAYEFNTSTGAYEPTDDLAVSPGDVNARFVELYQFDFASRSNDEPFDWFLTSAKRGESPGDRFPNTGEATYGNRTFEINGTAVAWNATAGTPAAETPVSFRLYNPYGTIVANRTVQTDTNGRANADLSVKRTSGYGEYTLEISDTYGNTIRQKVTIWSACIELCYVSASDVAYSVYERWYTVARNDTVTLHIPIYDESSGTISPYRGNASLRLYNHETERQLIRNDLNVDDGIIRTTIDLSETALDDEGRYVGISVALNADYRMANATTSGGFLKLVESGVVTQIAPYATVVKEGNSATLSFQQVAVPGRDPANVSAKYVGYWITDRQVASLYSDLPTDTVQRLKERRHNLNVDSTRPLSAVHKRQIREAIRNLSAQGVHVKTTRGVVAPTDHGVGTFTVTPPEGTRYGLVFASPNGRNGWGTVATVFVEGRVEQYTDEQTEPQETTRYDLNVRGEWGRTQDGNTVVPKDNVTVSVSLTDRRTEELVDNATVKLYTTLGRTRTVHTSGSHAVEVTIELPERDWQNLSYQLRTQQILGVAVGYHTSGGKPISDTDSVYGSVYEQPTGVQPVVDMSYDKGVLTTRIDYLNSSNEPVPGETTVFAVTQQRRYWAARDVAVGFVDPGDQTSITFNTTDTAAPEPDESQSYEVGAKTADLDETTFVDEVDVNGLSATVQAPDALTDEKETTVTITVTNRNGDPIENAVVRWHYLLYEGDDSNSGGSSLPREIDGGARIATTNSEGIATVEVSADIAESIAARQLVYQVGVVTQNASRTLVTEGSLSVQQTDVTVTGSFASPDGTAAANDTVALYGTGQGAAVSTNGTGSFTAQVEGNAAYDVQYYQRATDGTLFPRDGVADLYAADRITVGSSSLHIGERTLPNASVLDVRVVDTDGDPVENASVTITHLHNNSSASFRDSTSNAGYLNHSATPYTGVEVDGSVEITVRPSRDTARLVQESVTKQVTVTNDTTVTVTLTEDAVQGRIVYPNETTVSGDYVVAEAYGFNRTDARGEFEIPAGDGATDVVFYQGHDNDTPGALDGVPDAYAIDRVNGATALGNVSLPSANVLNVTVVDESGDPVANATIVVNQTRNGASAVVSRLTNESGLLTVADRIGLETVGNVTVTVRPPQNATRFQRTEVVRSRTITSDTNLTITLQEKPTVAGNLSYPSGAPAAGDTIVTFGSESSDDYTGSTVTLTDGSFRLWTTVATDVDVQYYQGSWSNNSTIAPRDGIVDVYAIDQVNTTSGPVDLGNVTVPNGSVVNVTVVDEDGVAVGNARISVEHYAGPIVPSPERGPADAGIRNITTNADGELELDTEQDGETVGIELRGNVTVTVRPPSDSKRYVDQVYRRNLTVTGERNLTVTLNETAEPESAVSLAPATANTTLTNTQTYDLVVETARGGVGAFEATLNLTNASVAEITAVEIKGDPGFETVNISANGSAATFDGALMDTADTGRVVIATVTVKGDVQGRTGLDLSISALGTENGSPYTVTTVHDAELAVEGVPELRDGYAGPPTDPDGDGVFEDVNGDGEVNIVDVQALYTTRKSSIVQNNAELFDVNGDGEVNIVDVQALYVEQGGA